jgi:hypothetical protein
MFMVVDRRVFMAQYQIPPDPRKENDLTPPRPRQMRADSQEPAPWLWLLLGLVVSCVGLLMAVWVAMSFLLPPPLAVEGEAVIVRLTAPATAVPSPTPINPTPTPIPSPTAEPTVAPGVVPPTITVDYYATVINTAGVGVSVRGGPSTANVRVTVVPEGSLLLVVGGPVEGDNLVWWQIRLEDGTEGWVAGDFLEPAAAP